MEWHIFMSPLTDTKKNRDSNGHNMSMIDNKPEIGKG
jgi:hypothetical protein